MHDVYTTFSYRLMVILPLVEQQKRHGIAGIEGTTGDKYAI